MMTQEEIQVAFKKHFPIVVELKGFNSGVYYHSYISALITRYDARQDKNLEQIEVSTPQRNSVMVVAPNQIRLATPQEIIECNIK